MAIRPRKVHSPTAQCCPKHDLDSWLDSHGYASVADIRGAALRESGNRETLLHRLQYIKTLDEADRYEG